MEHSEWIMLGTILVYMALIVGVGIIMRLSNRMFGLLQQKLDNLNKNRG